MCIIFRISRIRLALKWILVLILYILSPSFENLIHTTSPAKLRSSPGSLRPPSTIAVYPLFTSQPATSCVWIFGTPIVCLTLCEGTVFVSEYRIVHCYVLQRHAYVGHSMYVCRIYGPRFG